MRENRRLAIKVAGREKYEQYLDLSLVYTVIINDHLSAHRQ